MTSRDANVDGVALEGKVKRGEALVSGWVMRKEELLKVSWEVKLECSISAEGRLSEEREAEIAEVAAK